MSQSEGRIHQECYVWFHNTFPEYRGLLCYNFGNSKNRIDGALNRSKGLQAGRADFTLYWSADCTVFIEMKDDHGRQSTAQMAWQRLVEARGFRYLVCRSIDDFIDIINKIIDGGCCEHLR